MTFFFLIWGLFNLQRTNGIVDINENITVAFTVEFARILVIIEVAVLKRACLLEEQREIGQKCSFTGEMNSGSELKAR